ncbi:MerR family transcriptional regulator [Clostridium baratii]|uniref:MerR family transcriptional regulator n=1 Tax=Clostridium baratii TaxID=1561 RepID=UPI0030D1FA8B
MTIKEVSERFNLSQDTLRYYERIGLIPSINRNKSGIRDYTEEDCGWIEFIKCMRNAGLPIEVLIEQRKQLEEKMNEMKKTIERLDNKILRYEDKILEKEKTLQKQVSKL